MKIKITPETAGASVGALLGAVLIIKTGIPARMAVRVELAAMAIGAILAAKSNAQRYTEMRLRKTAAPAAALLLAATTAAHAAATSRLPGFPGPGKNCGDYIDDCPRPGDDCFGETDCLPRRRTLDSFRAQTAAVTAAVGNHDLDKASEGLERMFVLGAEKSGGVVFAGAQPTGPDEGVSGIPPQPKTEKPRAWSARAALTVPSPRQFGAGGRQTQGRIVLVGAEGTVRDLAINLGATVIAEGVKKGADAIERYVDRDQTQESIKEYGGCRLQGTCDR